MKRLLTSVLLAAGTASAFAADAFTLKLDNLHNGRFTKQQILSEPYGFGCSGANQSPAVSWENAPAGTKSFVLIMHDKDAPTGGLGWTHWVVANIPANVNKLPAGISANGQNLPNGALQTRTDGGVAGYMGACPPEGQKHRYEFKLIALKTDKLPNVTADATPALVGFFTQANKLGEASIIVEDQR